MKWIIKDCAANCTQLDPLILTTTSELYIPARTLAYGIYELQFIVTMTKYPSLTTSASVYIRITPSGITANLIQLGTSMITSGYKQDLKLDPGSYSVNPDEDHFNSTVN